MIYPPFLQTGDTIGITAPSAGIDQSHMAGYLRSLTQLSRRWQVVETPNVRSPQMPSSPGPQRAAELAQLAADPAVRAVLCACGGDFLVEMLPYVDWQAIGRDPKWYQGYSDPTGLLFPITTRLDMATLYGPNAGSYDMDTLHPSLENNLSILSGCLPVQHGFSRYQPLEEKPGADGGYRLTRPAHWQAPNGDFSASGRLLGGCLDVLDILRGTEYAPVPAFDEKYGAEGVLWYFDIFAMTAEQVFYCLWSMKQAGWFRHASGFLFGRVMFPRGEFLTYEQAVRRALGEVPVALECDIGHVKPDFTLMNGAVGHVTVERGRAHLEMELKE